VDLLQEWFGYVVSGDTSHHKMLFIEGPRRSGKGTIARMMTHLLGGANVSGTTLSAMGQRFGLAPLQHKLLAVVPDARISSRADLDEVVQTLLSVSGQDGVLIDRKNRDAVSGRVSARFMVLSNELPRLPDNSDTISYRFVMLRTSKSFYGHENFDLEEELLAELPGIFAWALDGYDRLLAQKGFTSPDYEHEMREEMADLNSPITTFVQDECVLAEQAWVDVRTLFARYLAWAEEQNQKARPMNLFVRDVRAATGVRSERMRQGTNRQRILHGITVRNLSERAMHS
jgi:putative DNA primase/helicase